MKAEARCEALRVLLAGGGTGGHIFPGLAVAEVLDARGPSADLLFVGSPGGIEERLVSEAGRRLALLPSVKIRGPIGYLRLPLDLSRALLAARRLIADFRPHVVVALGGYASLAPALAAKWRGLPVLVMEQNAIPGRVSRLLARFAAEVCATYEESVPFFARPGRVGVTGNPVREAVLRAGMERQRRGEGERLGLLVAGGSQGAINLNRLFMEAAPHLEKLADRLRVVHLCGPGNCEQVAARAARLPLEIEVVGFEKDMAARYAASDLVLSRAGATALAEISVCGLPVLLVPFPHAKDNHQQANARSYARRGGAELLPEAELSGEKLSAAISALVDDHERRERMGASMRACGRPDAGREIARRIIALAGRDLEA